jgi:hypothetical protein
VSAEPPPPQIVREAIVGIEDPRPLSRERPSSRAALKRALWCRWFHRYRWRRGEKPASVTSSAGGQSLRFSAGPGRSCCDACAGHNYGRAYRRWLAS